MIAHNFLKNQISINFDYTGTSATVYFIQAQIMTMPVLLGRGAPEERNRPQAHTTSGHGKKLWPPLIAIYLALIFKFQNVGI
jgi:hypothetical protein